MNSHVWVIEVRRAEGWRFFIAHETRDEARQFQLERFEPGKSRIRKYVPA